MRSNRTRPVALRKPEPPARESWYRIENRAGVDEPASIWLYDEVGLFGVSAAEFVKDLRSIKTDTIDLHVSSPGGDVFDGVAIHSALKNHPATINVHIDGLAASAASFIAMAGDSISIARNAQVMVHEGHAVCAGDSRDMRKCAELLDKVSDNIADVYAQRTGHSVEHWREVMREETWYTADEAVKAGLADRVSGASKAKNTWDLSVFMFAGRDGAPDPFEVWAKAALESPDEDPGPVVELPPVSGDTATVRAVLLAEIADAPVVDLTGEPDELILPDVADTIRALHEIRFDVDLLKAAVHLGINDVPAPDPRPTEEPPAIEEPAFTYLPAVRRALKEAAL